MTAYAVDIGMRPGRFVLRVAAWLPAAFLVWYLAGPLIAWLVALLATGAARIAFADLVGHIEQEGHVLVFVSTLRQIFTTPAGPRQGILTVDVNVLLYTFGWPMLAALNLAARQPHVVRTMLAGFAVLAPFATWGVVADFLKHVVFDTGAAAEQVGFGPLQREAIAYAYQFGVLILPTVAPAVLWVLTHRRFLESFARG